MRINTTGSKEFRNRLYERAADAAGESTKSAGIDAASTHLINDREAKQEAIDYLSGELPPRKLEKVADMLSTPVVKVEISVEAQVE